MRVGVDTGGTFTDVVARSASGLRVVKRLSTPRDPAEAVLDGVRRAAGDAQPVEVVHSSTVATNALLERRGGPTVLVTTAGFEDVLEIGRQARPSLYALHPVVPPPLVDAPHRLGVRERIAFDGSVLTPLEPAVLDELRARVAALAGTVRSVAVCLLHAYVNPAHERQVRDALAPLGLPVSLSSDVLPVIREYERTATTVADAYVRPQMTPYLERLEQELRPARLRVMQSNGGAMSANDAAARPVRTLLSGPAAGVVGALRVARAAGLENLVTFDMGGTSTDVALVIGGALELADEGRVAGVPIQLPQLAIHTIGAGGGSIARRDAGGALKVGPQSAGADPGPAAYGRGGTSPTVTDANLVLGRLDPRNFLGGEMTLDPAAARAVISQLAGELGLSPERAAEDLIAVADAVMARAIKTISVERGHDPAELTLVPFGGAGGMHACAVARELGVEKVLIPPQPGLLCAYGALAADVVHDFVHTLLTPAGPSLKARALGLELDRLRARAEQALDADGVPPHRRAWEAACTLRYRGQSFELAVPVESDDDDLVAAFHQAHQARYGWALDREVELVTVRLRAVGATDEEPLRQPSGRTAASDLRITSIFQGRAYGARVFDRHGLADDQRLEGPALVVEYSATTWLPPGVEARVLDGGALLVSIGKI
jgi:N-methylhydantoinase A